MGYSERPRLPKIGIRRALDPVIYGFGAAASAREACAKSLREAMQRLCFIWGQEAVLTEPVFHARPDFHLDYLLHPKRQNLLRRWLAGEFYHPDLEKRTPDPGLWQLFDLTPAHYHSLSVVKAQAPGLLRTDRASEADAWSDLCGRSL